MFISCESHQENASKSEETEYDLTAYNDFLIELEESVKSSQEEVISSIYNSEQVYWIQKDLSLKDDAVKAIEIIKSAAGFGLNPDNYQCKLLDSLSNIERTPTSASILELTISVNFFRFCNHLKYGMIPNDYYKKITELEVKKDSIRVLDIFSNEDIVEAGLALQPQHHYYKKLQKALDQFYQENELTEDIIYIPNFKKDSVEAYAKAKEVLVKLNYLKPEDTGIKVVNAVKEFQKSNGLTPDGLIGKYTVQMLELSTRKMYFQAAANLEKWRWMAAWGDTYFFANIPEYVINVYQEDSLRIQNRTVVGTFSNQTPEVDSKLEYFIVNPEWYVPYSITLNELIPKQKKDSTYLQRNGYAITSGQSMSNVNWNTASASSIKIKQKSGDYNALGKVKFIFNNKHSVYFHDTPSKSFFKKDIRSYSHGCVRVQDPFDIAYFILENEANPEWPTTLDSLLKYQKTKTFTPQKEYPVHIGYFTSTTDSLGRLRTLIDVYNRDTLLLKLFEEYYFEPLY